MKPGQRNLRIPRGATFRIRFTWKRNGVPVSLTGYTGRMQAREFKEDTASLFDLTTENGGLTITDPGVIDVFIDDDETGSWTWERAYWDIKLYKPNGDEYFLLEGQVDASLQVTRP